MKKNIFSLLVALLTPLTMIWAQPKKILEVDYAKAAQYEVGGVKVIGAKYSDESAIINIAGLRVGQKLEIPNKEVLPRAIKALWNLRLFTDVEINVSKKIGEVVFLDIVVQERPRLTRFDFKNLKKAKTDELKDIVKPYLLKGGILTETNLSNAKNALEKYYVGKGFLDTNVEIREIKDEVVQNGVRVEIDVDRKDRVRIQNIVFEGNENVKAQKLRKQMKETKRKTKLFASSKLIQKDYEDDKNKIIAYYNTVGFRDARIASDSIWRQSDGDLLVKLKVDEGNRYFFRNIVWKGNSIYTSEYLSQVLGINKGDVYNQELITSRLSNSRDGRDISSLYMDNGYLFFRVEPSETAIEGDSLDLEMRVFEGPQATNDRIAIKGNDRTHEHVIRRELRTTPGAKFSRADIIRSQREIASLGFFNPETLGIQPLPNLNRGTVDIEYKVEEKSSDQLELSAGWGGRTGIIGTLGVTFNNFSLRNIFKKEAWSPLPQGDGQRLSIRAQTNGRYYQSYNLSLTEPWLGGRKPTNFTVGTFYSLFKRGTSGTSNYQSLGNLGASVSLGTRLTRPDDFFTVNGSLSFSNYSLNNWTSGGFFVDNGKTTVTEGQYNNVSLTLSLARNSINNPIFPQNGSRFTLTSQLTPPYSLLNGKNYENLSIQERYKWVEFHKWRLNAEWYTPLFDKFVMKASAKMGMLGHYNSDIGTSPFERFELGGDGISNQFVGIAGKEIISMRGYESTDMGANSLGGATVFDKFAIELRYPFSLNPNSTVYALAFVEGGNAWTSFADFNPLDVKRTVGVGLRVFLPMFGTLGFDYGLGFDKANDPTKSVSQRFGNFNIILGFEPE